MSLACPDSHGPSEKRRKYCADIEQLGSRREANLKETEGLESGIDSSKRKLRKILIMLRSPLSEADRIRLSQDKSQLEETIRMKQAELQALKTTLYELSTTIARVHTEYQESQGIISKGELTASTKLQWFFEWQVNSLQEEMEKNESIGGWRNSKPATRLNVDDIPEYTTFLR